MKKHQADACIIANSDPHLSEYITGYWKEREWISGFTGSNGIVVLTLEKMSLWTDSRYTLQAEYELKNVDAQIFTTRTILNDAAQWLNNVLGTGEKRIVANFCQFSVKEINIIKQVINPVFSFISKDLIFPLWKNRPSIPVGKIFLFEEKYAGKSASRKIIEVQDVLKGIQADVLVITALDDIAWLFNIRGNDIEYNPVAMAYAVVEAGKSILFISSQKLTPEIKNTLENQGILIYDYDAVGKYLATISAGKTVCIDETKINQTLYDFLPKHVQIVDQISPVAYLKSKKNSTEIAGLKDACIKDGVALVRFFMWLENNLPGGTLTEMSIAEKLTAYRAEQPLYMGDSFGTIAGYKGHGAIGHYHATADTNSVLKQEDFLLLDSGGQYLDGTTDITRTVALGPVTQQQKRNYTLVLKGNIALSVTHFPYGTCGFQLDVLARQYLWNNHINYGHGTGHGIGHFLCVHEGPQSIRVDNNNTVLEEGMVLSNEPGIYRPNEYGVRLENMMVVTKSEKTGFGEFMQFETLTLFPFDKKSIDFTLLNNEEMKWLNDYHAMVYEKLSSCLNIEEQEWLKQKTI